MKKVTLIIPQDIEARLYVNGLIKNALIDKIVIDEVPKFLYRNDEVFSPDCMYNEVKRSDTSPNWLYFNGRGYSGHSKCTFIEFNPKGSDRVRSFVMKAYSELSLSNISPEKESEKKNDQTAKEKIVRILGIIIGILQFVFFVIAKSNTSGYTTEEVVGTIKIGDMDREGADTVVHHSFSPTPLGLISIIAMFICAAALLILQIISRQIWVNWVGESDNKLLNKMFYSLFFVLTLIGLLIIVFF